MRLLVCAATANELAAWGTPTPETALLVSGVGVPATFSALATPPTVLPKLIVNIGIAGAYPGSNLTIGDIVLGSSEVYGDLGFALPEPPYFRPITQSPFGDFYATPYPLWIPAQIDVPIGRGCTVSTCTGTDLQGHHRQELYQAYFETMEGAAVAQIGAQWGVPVCEIRSISNLAADRNMQIENIRLSLKTLELFLNKTKNLFYKITEQGPYLLSS